MEHFADEFNAQLGSGQDVRSAPRAMAKLRKQVRLAGLPQLAGARSLSCPHHAWLLALLLSCTLCLPFTFAPADMPCLAAA